MTEFISEVGSERLQNRLRSLAARFPAWRSCRSDGNTLYRCMLVGAFDAVAHSTDATSALVSRWVACLFLCALFGSLPLTVSLLFSYSLCACAKDGELLAVDAMLGALSRSPATAADDFATYVGANDGLDKTGSAVLRKAAAVYVLANPSQPFDGVTYKESVNLELEQYCRAFLLHLGQEGDDLACDGECGCGRCRRW